MSDRSRQRSAAPGDARAFDTDQLPRLRSAVEHLSLLEGLGYEGAAPLALVGDHFQLTRRQRHAVRRCACSVERQQARARKRVDPTALTGRRVMVDGFNLLITLETALGGGVVLRARDGCLRDLAYLRGTWRRVLQTSKALELLCQALSFARVASAHVLVDRQVSNSGRLVAMLRESSQGFALELTAEAATNVDARLIDSQEVVASADSVVLDACRCWTNLTSLALELGGVHPWWVDLG